jgi:hypothetical protein
VDAQALTQSNLEWLTALPQGPAVVDGQFAISHGTPVDEDAYIFGELEALNVFRHTDFPLCFFGHSHFPVIFALSPDAITTVLTVAPSFKFKLQEGVRYLINPARSASRATATRCARSRSTTATRASSRSTGCRTS